jgi:hypothetical protein
VVRFPTNARETIVKAHPFYPSLAVDLTPIELQALQKIDAGERVSATLYARLEALEMIEKGLSGWRLTEQGSYRLVAGQGWQLPRYPKPDQLSN